MRPGRPRLLTKTGWLAELVCSNSLKSEREHTAPWLLKQELRRLGLPAARRRAQARVRGARPDRGPRVFARTVTERLQSNPRIEVRREEVTTLPRGGTTVVARAVDQRGVARGHPLLIGSERLYFYDSISPIVDAESIDTSKAFRASRYAVRSTAARTT